MVTLPAPPTTGAREGEGFIKRIAGLPGEEVEVRAGRLLVDGAPVDEPWAWLDDGPGPDDGPRVVPVIGETASTAMRAARVAVLAVPSRVG